MTQISSNRSLFEVLKEKDSALAAQVEKIKEIGLKDWVGLLLPDKGSHAGYPHLMNVERMADKMIPDHIKEKLSSGELFLLLCSIFLHDIGKIIAPSTSPAPDDKNPDKKARPNPSFEHHIRSEQIINKYSAALGLPDDRIAQYCGLIAFCHCLKEPPKTQPSSQSGDSKSQGKEVVRTNFRTTSLAPYGVLRIPLLAAIVRIADETDNLWTRAVNKYWRDSLDRNQENLVKAFRRHIEDIEFSFEGECLIIHVSALEEADDNGNRSTLPPGSIKSLDQVRGEISKIIKSGWGKLLKRTLGIHFREAYIEHDNRLHTDLKLITSLKHPPLGEILGDDGKTCSVLFDAAKELSLGSYGHSDFTWKSLEAQVGRPLTDFDKWLTLRMGNISPEFRITGNLESENIQIELGKDDKDIAIDDKYIEHIRAEVVGGKKI
jgi:hypothetical protein